MATATPLKRNQKVHALKDLLGVPAGTKGKVLLIKGMTWKRYWVDFDNGVSAPDVSRSEVGSKDDWERAKDGPVHDDVVETTGGDTAVDDGPAGEPIDGVPFHLIERSRAARQRMGGS